MNSVNFFRSLINCHVDTILQYLEEYGESEAIVKCIQLPEVAQTIQGVTFGHVIEAHIRGGVFKQTLCVPAIVCRIPRWVHLLSSALP